MNKILAYGSLAFGIFLMFFGSTFKDAVAAITGSTLIIVVLLNDIKEKVTRQ